MFNLIKKSINNVFDNYINLTLLFFFKNYHI